MRHWPPEQNIWGSKNLSNQVNNIVMQCLKRSKIRQKSMSVCVCVCVCVCVLGPRPRHMEVLRLGVKS